MLKNNRYKRTIFSWSIYDFANQPFTTIIVTFIYAAFFIKYMVLDINGDPIDGTIFWGRAISISSIIIAILSPLMGAIADSAGYRKLFLIFWTWVCIIFSFLLYFPIPGEYMLALVFFCIANIGFEMGGVFLNAYLPEIAPRNQIGRISGYGWSFGYVGGLIALAICYNLFIENSSIFGYHLDKANFENIRIINIFIAIWLAIFSIPTFLFVKDKSKVKKMDFLIMRNSYVTLKNTFVEIKKYREITKFLLARLLYNDALITIFAFGGIYAVQVFNFGFKDIFIFGIVLNITAGLGAFLFGYIDDYIGGKKTIQITNLGFVFACLLAAISPNINSILTIPKLEIYSIMIFDTFSINCDRMLFWFSGCLIGIFSGPNQAASRSLMGRLIPKSKESEFYGFFAFSGKATAFLGPLIFTVLLDLTGNYQLCLVAVALLFFIGFTILRTVNEESGIEQARDT